MKLESGRVIQFKLEYGDVEEAWSEWVSTGKYIARSFAEKLMKGKKYKDTSHLVWEEMHEEELLNAADLDELQAVYGEDDSGSIVTSW